MATSDEKGTEQNCILHSSKQTSAGSVPGIIRITFFTVLQYTIATLQVTGLAGYHGNWLSWTTNS